MAALVAELLVDEDWWVRSRSKAALKQLGPEARQYVVPYLESADEFAREGAAEVLRHEEASTDRGERGRRPVRLVLEGVRQ